MQSMYCPRVGFLNNEREFFCGHVHNMKTDLFLTQKMSRSVEETQEKKLRSSREMQRKANQV